MIASEHELWAGCWSGMEVAYTEYARAAVARGARITGDGVLLWPSVGPAEFIAFDDATRAARK